MFEHNTYEALVKSALARVPGGIDKREGSMVFNGVAPSMAELAQLFIGLDFVFKATYLLTAPREYLIKRASDRNMAPKPASPAVFRVADDAERHLRATFSQAKFYYLSDINKRDMVLSALGELIACYMAVYRDNTEFSKPVEQIRTLIIREHARPGFALDEAIRAMPFHYDYLRKLFKKEMGLTPLEYMTKLRMRKAEALLGGMGATGYTVGDVAA